MNSLFLKGGRIKSIDAHAKVFGSIIVQFRLYE